MKIRSFLLSTSLALASAGALTGLSSAASAAALFTLEGTVHDAKLESQSKGRLSVLGWTAPEQASAIVSEYRKYAESQDHEAFRDFLQGQETKGYLFTSSPTGHSIKYAWQDQVDPQHMVLVVTPALKANNPYMWKTPNNSPAPFSVVEVKFEGDEATLKTSLEAEVEVSSSGNLQLKDYADAPAFATMEDATPYYLKQES